MKEMKIRGLLVLMFAMMFGFLTITANNQMVSAQEAPTVPKIPGLDVPPDELSESDLEKFVNLAFNEQITVAQTHTFYEQLSGKQKELISDLVAIKAGIPLEDWNRDRELHQTEPIVSLFSTQQAALSSEIWRQFIENTWTWGHPPGSTFASFYYTAQYCEGANPDPDNDYVFYYSMNYSMNPDGLRWTSDSSQVYLAFMAAYDGDLNGYAQTWNQVRLCLGTGGVFAAGGANKVKNNVFLHPNN